MIFLIISTYYQKNYIFFYRSCIIITFSLYFSNFQSKYIPQSLIGNAQWFTYHFHVGISDSSTCTIVKSNDRFLRAKHSKEKLPLGPVCLFFLPGKPCEDYHWIQIILLKFFFSHQVSIFPQKRPFLVIIHAFWWSHGKSKETCGKKIVD